MVRSSVQRYRTADIESSVGSFDDLLLPEPLVRALARAGYTKPSPVQSASIPIGRIGKDMIIQAKSGTGKTVVFATICLERVKASSGTPQVCCAGACSSPTRSSSFIIRPSSSCVFCCLAGPHSGTHKGAGTAELRGQSIQGLLASLGLRVLSNSCLLSADSHTAAHSIRCSVK